MIDFITYTGVFISSCMYAYILDTLKRRYEPRWVWVTVAIGVAIVLGWLAVRIALGLPSTNPWYVWLLTFWHFVAAGLPIVFWQSWQDRDMLADALKQALKEQNGERNTTKRAAPMDAATRRDTDGDGATGR